MWISRIAWWRDHPRACGEDWSGSSPSRWTAGPPPRMRGRLDQSRRHSHTAGITPAHAGKTRSVPTIVGASSDHPRACREDMKPPSKTFTVSGPPPRMRGRRQARPEYHGHPGTTPAHAGKTSPPSTVCVRCWDHPRACGEDGVSSDTGFCHPGPPPRMRGRQRATLRRTSTTGTTPAHAGKTAKHLSTRGPLWDHPRACGEDFGPVCGPVLCLGPPPRMRGRPLRARVTLRASGTTPAHAGKTVCWFLRERDGGDHPRACGEDLAPISSSTAIMGPPPRMRGRLTRQGVGCWCR